MTGLTDYNWNWRVFTENLPNDLQLQTLGYSEVQSFHWIHSVLLHVKDDTCGHIWITAAGLKSF